MLAAAGSVALAAAPGTFRLDVPAHGFEEHCLELAAGDRIRYHYKATSEVDFNIHYHRGNDVLYPVKSNSSRSADADFTASQAETYCLMWERTSDGGVRIDGAIERVKR